MAASLSDVYAGSASRSAKMSQCFTLRALGASSRTFNQRDSRRTRSGSGTDEAPPQRGTKRLGVIVNNSGERVGELSIKCFQEGSCGNFRLRVSVTLVEYCVGGSGGKKPVTFFF